ncbi:MAG: DegT/DnrJ/EryC1/StrS family aminotransferase [Agarilytica sp.]
MSGGERQYQNNIPFAKPSITQLEIKYGSDAVENGWGAKCYEYISKFEHSFADYIGVNHAISTSSCTGALHLGLRTLGIGPGDEVIVPVVTWIASVAPITYQGATPVFVDIDPNDFCLDLEQVERAITDKTKAIIVVHLYGAMPDMERLKDIAKRNNVFLIEDAAEGLGSTWDEKQAGSFGDFSVYSFHGTKTMTTGEGGMLVCNNKDFYDSASVQSNHGRVPSKHVSFWMDEIGLKYKMSNVQAAIGLAQVERMDEFIAKKRKIFDIYEKNFVGSDLVLNKEIGLCKSSYWLPAVIKSGLTENDRDEILAVANKKGIGLRPFFYPITKFPMFENQSREFPVAESVSLSGINLPSFHDITEEEQKIVVAEIKGGMGNE